MTIVHSGAPLARRSRFLGTAFPPFSKPLLKIVTAASLAGFGPMLAGPALAGSNLPTGGTVASGNVTIGTPSNNSLTITQTSSKAIINWQGFSVGQPNTVTFDNGSGATLNRVTGSAQSNIDGTLNATGSVYLLNPNGIVIGQTGVVNVGKNFVASTLGTSDAQFNASGPLTLNGNSQAAVVNLGKVGSLGGDVALVAQQTLNAGSISAPQGSVGVLTGTQVTLRDSTLDDGKFNVDVGNSTNQAVNKGNIAAAEAELKANGGNVYASATSVLGSVYAAGGAVQGAASSQGGLVGVNYGSITNAYATDAVGSASAHTVGGLVGNNFGALTDVYAAGSVTGLGKPGALIGTNQASGTITNGYYDTLVTGSLASIGVNYNSAGAQPHALTVLRPPTAQASYTGFDFSSIWMIAPGQTPTLQDAPGH